ncbi:UDP-N-acetylglucosamine--N-acetylmuramyl-(pentapeptide) pyrophosphoryl-undecaprenol N-acetylglucosamine transferase [Candidatus Woesearchaeota archaeon]|nr:UDP-N-acetylglucosamine--N-acetylmuramyl-(pentapeptide) pyrophosphoryl-undecaprenol N-acetylglucosamine transferase [Candidatus Woesearchaeota archaeon]
MRIAIVAGGTLGHVKPGNVLAQTLRKRHNVFYLTDRAMKPYVSGTPFLLDLEAKHTLIETPRFLMQLSKAYLDARTILKQKKIGIVLSMGGYFTIPAVLAARSLRIPVYLFEQNALPGRANRLLSRFSKLNIAFLPGPERYFKSKTMLCGNPVASHLFHLSQARSRKKLRIPRHTFVLLAFGGTNGAKDINEAVCSILPRLKKKHIFIIHVTGKKYYDPLLPKYSTYKQMIVRDFLADLSAYYAAADVVLCRAGATSLVELWAARKPAIIVPHPHVKDNHQLYNALYAAHKGTAIMIPSQRLHKELLPTLRLLTQKRLRAMSNACAACLPGNPTPLIVKTILNDHARTKKP